MAKIEYKNIQMRAPTYEKVKRAAKELGLNLGQTIDWIMEHPDKANQFDAEHTRTKEELAKANLKIAELKGRLGGAR